MRHTTRAKPRATISRPKRPARNSGNPSRTISRISAQAQELTSTYVIKEFEKLQKASDSGIVKEIRTLKQIRDECLERGRKWITDVVRKVHLECLEVARDSLDSQVDLARNLIRHTTPFDDATQIQKGDRDLEAQHLSGLNAGDNGCNALMRQTKRPPSAGCSTLRGKYKRYKPEVQQISPEPREQTKPSDLKTVFCPYKRHTCLEKSHDCLGEHQGGSKLRRHVRNTFKSHYCEHCRRRFSSSTAKSSHQELCAKQKLEGLTVEIHTIDEEDFAACKALNTKQLALDAANKIIDDYCSKTNKIMECKRCDELRKTIPPRTVLDRSQKNQVCAPETDIEAGSSTCSSIIENCFPLPAQPAHANNFGTIPYNRPIHHSINHHSFAPQENASLGPGSESDFFSYTAGTESDLLFSQIGMTTNWIDHPEFFDNPDCFTIAMIDELSSIPSNDMVTNSAFFSIVSGQPVSSPSRGGDIYSTQSQDAHISGQNIAASQGSCSAMDLDIDMRDYNRDLDFEMVTVEEPNSDLIRQEVVSAELDPESFMANASGPFTMISQPNYYNEGRHQSPEKQPQKSPRTPSLKDLLETRDILAAKLVQPPSPRNTLLRSGSRESLVSVQSMRSDYVREWQREQAAELGFKPTEIVPVMECDEGGETDGMTRKEAVISNNLSTDEGAEKAHTSLVSKPHCRCQRDSETGEDGVASFKGSKVSTVASECICSGKISSGMDTNAGTRKGTFVPSGNSFLSRFTRL